jgi:hypothetical protein
MSPSDLTRVRINRWIEQAKPLALNPVWTETRLVIDYAGHTFIVANGQIFQCAHCGHYDPEWNATEVLTYFKDVLGIKPYEIEVTCSVALAKDEK